MMVNFADAYMRHYGAMSFKRRSCWAKMGICKASLTLCFLKQCWDIVNWNFSDNRRWNLERNSYTVIQENAFENVVCIMAGILSRPQCVFIFLFFTYIYTGQGFTSAPTTPPGWRGGLWKILINIGVSIYLCCLIPSAYPLMPVHA